MEVCSTWAGGAGVESVVADVVGSALCVGGDSVISIAEALTSGILTTTGEIRDTCSSDSAEV